ncbi:hypothetical protein X566_00120 [Afipia sp. P52-10]|nr:hypothetical protein X566_00120 [Afipia sp. P52-10]
MDRGLLVETVLDGEAYWLALAQANERAGHHAVVSPDIRFRMTSSGKACAGWTCYDAALDRCGGPGRPLPPSHRQEEAATRLEQGPARERVIGLRSHMRSFRSSLMTERVGVQRAIA